MQISYSRKVQGPEVPIPNCLLTTNSKVAFTVQGLGPTPRGLSCAAASVAKYMVDCDDKDDRIFNINGGAISNSILR